MPVGDSGDAQLPGGVRIGLVHAGDARDPAERSGTPHGVVTGLESLGVDVVTVNASLPRSAERALSSAAGLLAGRPSSSGIIGQLRARGSRGLSSPVVSATRGAQARRGQRGQRVDGWIQIGAGFTLAAGSRYVVYDDMSIPSARELGFGHWPELPERMVRRRMANQRLAYRGAVRCCTEASWAARSIRDQYQVPLDQLAVVGTAAHRHARPLRDWSVPRFLFVGADWGRKNGAAVLAALAAVRSQVPTATLDVVGGHPPIDQDGVRTHGVLRRDSSTDRERVHRLFDRATCLVVPSLFEPAGIVFTEAAAVGLPAIGGNRGGSGDVIGPGGLTVQPRDVGALVTAMLRMCRPDEAARFGSAAQSRGPLFTWPAVASRLLTALGVPHASPAAFLPLTPGPEVPSERSDAR